MERTFLLDVFLVLYGCEMKVIDEKQTNFVHP